ncbi:two-component system phosphate regulon sensor histidine kinase PhoR [Tepidimonas ignava]|uniref:Phosphate regulon sensor protein PhoR n=1 Tax=Tepidimonas ignava TaxID=114249 RepID=A0A4R3LGS9_9BURK|nr:phosphate regulon sensor histidine kinase PhoR [Tepidimonas ignava]TCS97644.1 two-component system phosphate regulon sensor histidine kinase PhoR [Tepidimonas ignava]TSE24081.1 Phosphate regulon sensor protein PhoR [Tepidimonas ignava]
MWQRTIALVACASGGAALVWLLLPGRGLGWVGALAGAVAWQVWDHRRWRAVLTWLREPRPADTPEVDGAWGELVARVRRALKAANRKARKAQARLQEFLSAIQASPNGVVLLSKEGTIEWCNVMAGEHLGFDAKRDLGQRIRNLVRDPVFIQYLNQRDFTQPVEIDARQARAGQPRRIAVQIFPYAKGRRLLLTRDVTALQLAEAMRRDFVANVSHEIRSPLTVIAGFIETLQTLPLDEAQRQHYLGLMAQQAQRMQALVDDLLTLSRLEGSPAPDASHWVAVSALVEEAAAHARALADVLHGGGQTIEVQRGPEVEVAGHAGELASALGNLASNAVRYTPADGHITVGWTVLPDETVDIWVRDDGPGIAPEHLPRLTERFYRVDRSRSRDTGGTGLGLAIVKHVAQRHGGELLIDSTVGKGSTFRLRLPPARVMVLSSPDGARASNRQDAPSALGAARS